MVLPPHRRLPGLDQRASRSIVDRGDRSPSPPDRADRVVREPNQPIDDGPSGRRPTHGRLRERSHRQLDQPTHTCDRFGPRLHGGHDRQRVANVCRERCNRGRGSPSIKPDDGPGQAARRVRRPRRRRRCRRRQPIRRADFGEDLVVEREEAGGDDRRGKSIDYGRPEDLGVECRPAREGRLDRRRERASSTAPSPRMPRIRPENLANAAGIGRDDRQCRRRAPRRRRHRTSRSGSRGRRRWPGHRGGHARPIGHVLEGDAVCDAELIARPAPAQLRRSLVGDRADQPQARPPAVLPDAGEGRRSVSMPLIALR